MEETHWVTNSYLQHWILFCNFRKNCSIYMGDLHGILHKSAELGLIKSNWNSFGLKHSGKSQRKSYSH